MPANRVSSVLCSALVVLFISTTISSAQSQTFPLIVRVTDPTGRPVAGARLTVSTRDARMERSSSTDDEGTARFDPVPEGDYVLDIEALGFARLARPIVVGPEEATVVVTLVVAGVTERVVVTAAGHLQTAAEVSKAVTGQIADGPVVIHPLQWFL